ncbi:MAG TPA: hypothetical protein VH933_17245 [Aestuariivirgaceae bacterium]|jgi:hypothetical protein
MKIPRIGILGGVNILLLGSVPAWAADYVAPVDVCAVSDVNGKIHGQGGSYESDESDGSQFQGVGSLSFPLGCMFGAQIDAGAGKFGDFDAFGIGAHLFMRDPTSYLVGIHATYENWDLDVLGDDVSVWRVGPEVELYFANISLEAWAGFQDGDDNVDSSFFARLTVAFYATENLRLAGSFRQSDDFTSGAITGEWQLSSLPLSLTAEAEFGEDDFTSILGGVKIYFGGSTDSLIDRHRYDDPDDGLFNFAGSASSFGAAPQAGECEDGSVTDECCADSTVEDGCCTDACCADGVCEDEVLVPLTETLE